MRPTILLLALLLGGIIPAAPAQPLPAYTWPREEAVRARLDRWQDLKFGMLVHWGLYSHLGIVESWAICSEEEEWIPRDSSARYDDYKRAYWATIDSFNPTRFDPTAWARAGKRAGMNYLIFTTKHHDGFAMYDTRQSDFSITRGAFRDDPRRDVTREVFNAFREEGYMIGAYFSKPDWHSPYYWWDRYATPDRNVNYSIHKHPGRWQRFKEFTYNQIEELLDGDYGPIDILWLDGGWIRPAREGDVARAGRFYKGAQDIDMPRVAAMARALQPGIIIVDRSVPGEFENYRTPERGIPDTLVETPWESCIPLGNDWGHVPGDTYKTPARVIHLLVEIVAKGGNLLLGIGPRGDGTLDGEVVARLEEIGAWLARDGEAIYGTRPVAVPRDGNVWFTRSKEGDSRHAIACFEEGQPLPRSVTWRGNEPPAGACVTCRGKPVRWRKTSRGVEVTLPRGLPAGLPALAFSWKAVNPGP
ncbi:MAG: alpha-L-fucosidase [Odoribacteraceae bacterium]|jgi:alpha-L-fucosidase|nr:alpha-L-fucosidase [Odoribacteraceae bacterium]